MRRALLFSILIVNLPLVLHGGELRGRVAAPAGVPLDSLRVYYHEQQYSEVENDDHEPRAETAVDREGLFQLAVTSPTLNANLEIVGEGVRRARFAWPADLTAPGKETSEIDPAAAPARAVFRLEAGAAMDVIVRDAATDAPVAGALIGPIVPDEHANVREMEKTFPFFARTDEAGRARVQGLMPGAGYRANVVAEGYQRRRAVLQPPGPAVIELARGGAALTGEVRGHASSQPYGSVAVALSGGPENLYAMRRAGPRGEFEFHGLRPGVYWLQPLAPDRGLVMPQEYIVTAAGLSGVWLPYPEGIVVAGRVVDRETGEGVAGAALRLIDAEVRSAPDGQFEFPRLTGPWPAGLRVEHEAYDFAEEDMGLDTPYPIEGLEMEDVLGLEVPLRRRRALVVIREGWTPESPPAALELWGPLEEEAEGRRQGAPLPVERHRIAAERALLPLPSAGSRAALLRTADGAASELIAAITSLEETTTTLLMRLDAGAVLEGSLAYEEGPPAPAFRAEVWSDAEGALPAPVKIREATPGLDGTFRLDALPPGLAQARLLRPDGPPWVEKSIVLERGETAALHHTVTRGGVLAGRVVDERGEGRAGIALTAYGRDPRGEGLRLETVSVEDGRFRFEGLGGEALQELRANHPDYTDSARRMIPLPDEEFELVLVPRAAIIATLRADAAALEEARAWLMLALDHLSPEGDVYLHFSPERRAAFGGEDHVRFAPETAGRYCVVVETAGAWAASDVIAWDPAGDGQTIELEPGETGALTVRVTGAAPEHVEEFHFELINAALPPEAGAAARADEPEITGATVRFVGLAPGVYHLRAADAQGEEWRAYDLIVRPHAETRHTLALERRRRRIEGEVVIAGRGGRETRPAVGARVQIYLNVPEAEPFDEVAADAEGRFAFDGTEAARPHLLRATLDGLTAAVEVPGEAQSREAARARIVLTPQVRVRLVAPLDLLTALEDGPAWPIVLMQMEGDGRMMALRAEELEDERAMAPGRWRVMWGERPLGEIIVPDDGEEGETAVITLPSGNGSFSAP